MISFVCKTRHFKKTLVKLKSIHKRNHIRLIPETCEITMIDGHVTLSIPGAIFGFDCTTKGTAKAAVSYYKLHHILEYHTQENLLVEFYDGSIRLGIVQLMANTVFLKDDKVLRTIILPNDYKDLDLLLLKNEGYTTEELEFNNLLHVIEAAERRVYYKIRKASLCLHEYGIMPKEIKKLLVEKLGVQLDLDEKDVNLLLQGSDFN
jgi:hypothetical protein